MNCNGTINLTCNKCGMNQQIPCNNFEHWDEVSEDEGAAGKEIQNESILEHICTICQNKIEVKASIWTYSNAPSHRPNSFNIDSVSGGELVNHNCNCI